MNKIIFAVLLSCLFRSSYVLADSYSEKPDYDMYAHPLLEISASGDKFASGKILKTIKTENRPEKLLVKIVRGAGCGRTVEAEGPQEGASIDSLPGTRVLISYKDDVKKASAVDYDRTLPLIVLLSLFSLLVLLTVGFNLRLGGLLTLFAGVLFIIFAYVPLIIRGYSPVLLTLATVFFITLATVFFIGKFSKKSVAALAGTLLSTAVVLALGAVFYPLANINGFSLEPVQMLNYFSKNHSLHPFNNFLQLLLSVLMISVCGVIIDVAVCVASSMEQVASKKSGISRRELVRYGMRVGRDVAATVSNTLILAYFGAELILILSSTISIRSLTHLFNSEWFFITVFQAFAGSIGFLLAVPFTALTAGYLMAENKKTLDKNPEIVLQ